MNKESECSLFRRRIPQQEMKTTHRLLQEKKESSVYFFGTASISITLIE
jgi:hypothetical protein